MPPIAKATIRTQVSVPLRFSDGYATTARVFTFDGLADGGEHLAFGLGEHFCLGAGLARQEVRVMIETLLARLPDLALAGPVERLRSGFISGIKHMPVRFTARAPQARQG